MNVQKSDEKIDELQELKTLLMHEREDFLAVINHRLRTPVLATDRIIRLMLDGQFGTLDEKQEQLLRLLLESIAEINRLMQMLLDIYRYRSFTKSLTFCETDIETLLGKLLPKIPNKGISVKLDVTSKHHSLYCDEEQFSCMLTHVVENAIKYAKSKVTILVSENGENEIKISVEDDGKGIAEDDIKGLFERFYLISAAGQYAPVTGAGLCLCAEIAKAHHGRIECKSVLDQGTTFEIYLPIYIEG